MGIDFEHIEADELGRMLRGMGINILCPDTEKYVPDLAFVFDLSLIRVDGFFALLSWREDADADSLIQIHADKTYANNPYFALLEDGQPRGIGIELRLFECDPDAAAERASTTEGYTVLQPALDREHGVREAFILDPLGYCWVPSRPI